VRDKTGELALLICDPDDGIADFRRDQVGAGYRIRVQRRTDVSLVYLVFLAPSERRDLVIFPERFCQDAEVSRCLLRDTRISTGSAILASSGVARERVDLSLLFFQEAL
jgi:hypothetical protein